MHKEKTYESIVDFYKDGGILHPIRAIVHRDLFDLNKVAKISSDINITTHMLRSKDELELDCGKNIWKELINHSNIIGYFSARKISDTEAIIGYSLCKPKDWPNFNKKIGKTIAVNKHSNFNWIIHADTFKIEQKLSMNQSLLDRQVNAGFIRDKEEFIVFHMLGTLNEQLAHFIKRVAKYYKFKR